MDSDDDILEMLEKIPSNSSKSASCTVSVQKSKVDSKNKSLENLLDELSTQKSARSEIDNPAHRKIEKTVSVGDKSTCSKPVKLGGEGDAFGSNGLSTSRATCDNLHCLDCDNRVLCFPGKKWVDDRCDYLFFSNAYPNEDRLSKSWVRNNTFRAYCCQCRWVCVQKITTVSSCGNLKWICAKH